MAYQAHKHSVTEYRVEDSGGVIRPIGQRKSYKGLFLIKAPNFSNFFDVGLMCIHIL